MMIPQKRFLDILAVWTFLIELLFDGIVWTENSSEASLLNRFNLVSNSILFSNWWK